MITEQIDLTTANVYGIYGNLGGGKSLTAVQIAVNFIKEGHLVISNIQLLGEISKSANYRFIEDINEIDFWHLPCGGLRGTTNRRRVFVILDECAEFFDQYSSTSNQTKVFLSWLRHSSKRGQMVFLIVQKPEFISKSIRLLINKWLLVEDLEQFRLPVLRIKIPFCSHLIWQRIFDRYGNLISRGFITVNKFDIAPFYRTSQIINHKGEYTNVINDFNLNIFQYLEKRITLFFVLQIIIFVVLLSKI